MTDKHLDKDDSTFQEIWHHSGSVEKRYKYWSSRLNSILHKCFLKKCLSLTNRYTQKKSGDILYISERKEIK